MFAVIYRSYLKSGAENEYQRLWHLIANYFIQHCGAFGSCLHKTEDGLWLAYSRWPDKKTRDAAWPTEHAPNKQLPQEIQEAIIAIKNCLDTERKLPDICLDVVDDLIFNSIPSASKVGYVREETR